MQYVTHGIVKERFVGLVDLYEKTSLSLKSAIETSLTYKSIVKGILQTIQNHHLD